MCLFAWVCAKCLLCMKYKKLTHNWGRVRPSVRPSVYPRVSSPKLLNGFRLNFVLGPTLIYVGGI